MKSSPAFTAGVSILHPSRGRSGCSVSRSVLRTIFFLTYRASRFACDHGTFPRRLFCWRWIDTVVSGSPEVGPQAMWGIAGVNVFIDHLLEVLESICSSQYTTNALAFFINVSRPPTRIFVYLRDIAAWRASWCLCFPVERLSLCQTSPPSQLASNRTASLYPSSSNYYFRQHF